MKWLIILLITCGTIVAGDQGITASNALIGEVRTAARGASRLVFFVGPNTYNVTVGNANWNASVGAAAIVIPITAVGDGQRLGATTYTLSSGNLKIIEVR